MHRNYDVFKKHKAFYIIKISKVLMLSHFSALSSGNADVPIHLLGVTSSLAEHSWLIGCICELCIT